MLEQRLQLGMKQTQRLIMTPRMQQSIHLLQLSTLELQNLLQKELVENPVLEEQASLEPSPVEDSSDGRPDADDKPAVDRMQENADLGPIRFDDDWQAYFEDSSDVGYVPPRTREEGEIFEAPIVQETTLEEHLEWQLNASPHIRSDEQRIIGEEIIHNLDEFGYLAPSVDELAERTSASPDKIEEVLRIIQGFTPVGVAARNLAECLEIQYHYYEKDSPLALEIIRRHLDDLEHRRLPKIARTLGISEQEVQDLADLIGTFDPRPARAFLPYESEYITPDVFVEKVGDEWQVRVNDEGTPPLRISKRYRQMLADPDTGAEERQYILDKFKSAVWLIRNIEQRKQTLEKVTRCIVSLQKNFLENGISGLKPMRLRDVADIVGVHESTVCRVVNNKYVQTPQGLFELQYFFSTGLETDNGQDASVKSVMDRIQRLIEDEDPKRPLSDQKITKILNADGISIARRTVAKYRERMGILPTTTRKRV
jgi:RNA polymerase sigma-54 factor